MARTRKTLKSTAVTVKVLVSFDQFKAGEEYSTEPDATVDGWVRAGLVRVESTTEEVTGDGEAEAGPGSAEPDVPGAVEG